MASPKRSKHSRIPDTKQTAPPDYFENLGADFENFMSDYDVEQRCQLIFDRLTKGVKWEGAKVLEVGCGTGRISNELIKRGADLTVVDIGPGLVSQTTHRVGCRGVAGDATNLPVADSSFDLVVSSECIEHTPNPWAALDEFARVVRPNGVICFTTPNRLWYPVLVLSRVMGVRKFAGVENWIFPHQAKQRLGKHGFGQIVVDGCHCWPFQLKFSRPLLRCLDHLGRFLFPLMINFGILAVKNNQSEVSN